MEQFKKLGISFLIVENFVVRILEKYVKLYLTKTMMRNAYVFK